nr:hypothetical protein [Tanacetum cinerariifolium]
MAMIAIKAHGSQGVNWDKQIQENTTEPGVLGNYDFVAKKGTNSTVPADDAVPTDVVPASAFISAEPTILADRVIAAEASVLPVDGIPADSEFAMMSLPSKVSLPVMGLGYVNLTGENDWGFGDSKPSVFNSNEEDWEGKLIYNSDYLGKFDEKADEGYIVGYSIPDSDDEQDVIIVQNSPTPVTTPVHDVLNHEEAAQSVLSPSLDLNNNDIEEFLPFRLKNKKERIQLKDLDWHFPLTWSLMRLHPFLLRSLL